MRSFVSRATATAVVALLTGLVSPVAAHAAAAAPGAPLRTVASEPTLPGMPSQLDFASCSQGPVGTVALDDASRNPVMLTAGHCTHAVSPFWQPTDAVYSPGVNGNELIGHRGPSGFDNPVTSEPVADLAASVVSQDWSVVELEPSTTTSRLSQSRNHDGLLSGTPVVLTGIRDYPDLAPGQISFDNFGQPICKDGDVSGRTCGQQLFRTRNSVFHQNLGYEHGDSGGVNFDPNTHEVIGVASQALGNFGRAQTADVALETAYGIADGQVNQAFQLAESTEPHDTDLRTQSQDEQATREWTKQNYPDVQFTPQPTFQQQLDNQVKWAQSDVQALGTMFGDSVATGDMARAQRVAETAGKVGNYYAETLSDYAAMAAIENVASTVTVPMPPEGFLQ